MIQPVRSPVHYPLRGASSGEGRGASATHTPARRPCAYGQQCGSCRVVHACTGVVVLPYTLKGVSWVCHETAQGEPGPPGAARQCL